MAETDKITDHFKKEVHNLRNTSLKVQNAKMGWAKTNYI